MEQGSERNLPRACIAAFVLSVLAGCKSIDDPTKASDADEMERTWQAALVWIPTPGGKYDISFRMDQRHRHNYGEIEGEWPTVIYMHGCSGFWSGTSWRLRFLTKNGYAVIAPNYFARQFSPKSCSEESYTGGLYRPVLGMRQADAGYAIARAKTLDWVDGNNVFLMGHSQGGVTTATFSSSDPDMSVKARIVEGWTCHAGDWHEYNGLNAPANEPVLSLVGTRDPWFSNRWNRGDCGRYMDETNGSRSVVYDSGHLSKRHELIENRDVQEIVLDFLGENTD